MSDYSFKLSPILLPVAGGILVVLVTMLVMVNVFNFTVSVSEKTLNESIQSEFPQVLAAGTLMDPELHFVNEKVAICVTFEPATPGDVYRNGPVRLCAQGKPVWNEEKSAVYIGDLELLSIKANWLAFKTSKALQEFLTTFVFGELDDLKIYESKQLIGAQVDSVKVIDKVLKIKL